MPDRIEEKAYAKLNISLDVTERRSDGYHDMLMVMQTVSLYDEVSIMLNGSGRVRARTSLAFVPGDERNLAVRAALRFLSAIDAGEQGMDIQIDKRIPVGAGMGGGSADAAAVLREEELLRRLVFLVRLVELVLDELLDFLFRHPSHLFP